MWQGLLVPQGPALYMPNAPFVGGGGGKGSPTPTAATALLQLTFPPNWIAVVVPCCPTTSTLRGPYESRVLLFLESPSRSRNSSRLVYGGSAASMAVSPCLLAHSHSIILLLPELFPAPASLHRSWNRNCWHSFLDSLAFSPSISPGTRLPLIAAHHLVSISVSTNKPGKGAAN